MRALSKCCLTVVVIALTALIVYACAYVVSVHHKQGIYYSDIAIPADYTPVPDNEIKFEDPEYGKIYTAYLEGLSNYPNESSYYAPEMEMNVLEESFDIMHEVIFDYPLLSNRNIKTVSLDSNSYLSFNSLEGTELDKITEQDEAVIQEVKRISSLAKEETDGTQMDYIRYIYDYLSRNISYDFVGEGKTSESNNVYGALIEGKSQCFGMTCAFKMLLDEVGIESEVESGDLPDGEKHCWNVVDLGGELYVCDVTMGAAQTEDIPSDFIDEFSLASSKIWGLDNLFYNGFLISYDCFIERSGVIID